MVERAGPALGARFGATGGGLGAQRSRGAGALADWALADHLQTSRTLLVLDNCEHLIEASAVLAEMLLRSVRTCVSLPQAVKLWALVLATLLLSRKGPWSVPASCSTDYDPAVVWLWRKGTLPN